MDDDFLTIKDLKKAIKDLPDDMPIYYQRVHDVYFKKYGWSDNSKKLSFQYKTPDDEPDEYVKVFSAYKHPDDYVFVLNAHF